MNKEDFLEVLGLKRKQEELQDEIEENVMCYVYNDVADKFYEG
jgi:hypothetical protein